MNRPLYCLRFKWRGERRDAWYSTIGAAQSELRKLVRGPGGKATDLRILQFTFPDIMNRKLDVRSAVLYGLKKLGGPYQQQRAFERVVMVDETDAAVTSEDLADSMDVDNGRGMLKDNEEEEA